MLEHIPNDAKAMSELMRVMKKTGVSLLQVPIDMKLEETFEDPSIVTPEG
ncbi:hypothetical protein PAT3040_00895 [Paenibacillus agaridevorans]|uniref:SAM-dependent methyltransferase n=1 Tax=Paenibacillus agaridevorans TaxID=171404 RepID=A0A2R5EIF0_9BACL|nr:hypothetical protein PAT3040_00895 [Paenibacillus agaridevorans]